MKKISPCPCLLLRAILCALLLSLPVSARAAEKLTVLLDWFEGS